MPTEKPAFESYSVTGYKAVCSTDGDAFEATIRQNGKPFLSVLNSGTGGPNSYYPAKGCALAHGEALDEFVSDARAWAHAMNHEFKNSSEVEDLFTEHLVAEADYRKVQARNTKKGYPFTIVVKKDEFSDEIIGLREFDTASKELAKHIAAGRTARLLV